MSINERETDENAAIDLLESTSAYMAFRKKHSEESARLKNHKGWVSGDENEK